MKIKSISQEFSKNCASTCLRMVLSCYNHPAVRDVIESSLWHDEEGYTLETELALYARWQGFAVDCHAYNLYLTDPATDAGSSQEELIKKLQVELATIFLILEAVIQDPSPKVRAAVCQAIVRCVGLHDSSTRNSSTSISRKKAKSMGSSLLRRMEDDDDPEVATQARTERVFLDAST